MVELQKRGAAIPSSVIVDLRSAKLMIQIAEVEGSRGDASQKVDEYLGSVEAILVTEAQKALSSETVDQWLMRLEEATAETSQEKNSEDKFITGVPRDQKWIRVEPIGNLPTDRILQIAQESHLSVNPQKDCRLVVYGQIDDIKGFIKKMTSEAVKK